MLLVKTHLDKSLIHGLGVFLDEDVVQGQILWKDVAGFDLVFTADSIKDLPQFYKDFVQIYASPLKDDQLHLCCDNAKFLNHSTSPNMQLININGIEYFSALSDLKAGTELVCNYNKCMYLPNFIHPTGFHTN
jgi:hypothetical protein